MRISTISILLTIGIIVLLGACNPVVYSPTTHQVPMLKEPGEVVATAGKNTAENLKAVELQASVAVTKHLALMAGHYDFESTENNLGEGGGEISEVGIGYYNFIDNSSASNNSNYSGAGFSYDFFVGHGWGNGYLEVYDGAYSTDERLTRFDLKRSFIQGSLGWCNNYIDGALSSRFSYLNYSDVRNDLSHNGYKLEANPFHFLWEPALTVRLGYKFLKVQGQLGAAVRLGRRDFPINHLQGSIAVMLNFRPSWFKKN